MSKIVLVEQDEPLVRLMGWFLVEAGFEVSVLGRLDQVIDRLRTAPPDLVVCNSGLSADEKRRAFEIWKKLCPHLLIIDVWPTPPRPDVNPDSGADAHMHLPFHADGLIDTVRSLLP